MGGDVLQHVKRAETIRGSGGIPPGKFLRIDAKILQLRGIST